MKVYEVKEILDATLLSGEDQLDNIVAGAGGADLMEAFLAAATKDAVILTGLTSDDVIRTAKVAGVAAVVLVEVNSRMPVRLNWRNLTTCLLW